MTDLNQDEILNKINQLEDKVEKQSNTIKNLTEENKILESRLNHLNEYTEELEDLIQSNSDSIDDMKDIVMSGDKVHLSPAEKILVGNDWSDTHVNKSANRERAIKVLEEWDVRSSVVGTNNMERLYVKQIKDILDVSHKTAKRVAKSIQQLTEHKIKLYDTKEMKRRADMNNYLLLDDILITSKEDIKKLKQK